MTLSMSLNWKAPDSSQLVNLRLKDVAAKGFVSGGEVTKIAGVPQVNVAPFVCINSDGAVVRSSENVVLTPGDGAVTVLVLRSRYVLLGSPVMSIQVMPVGSYVTDSEPATLTVLAIVDLSVGAPHSEIAPDEILYSWTNGVDTVERNAVDPQARSFFRSPVENSGDLFTPGSQYLPPLADNRNGDVRLAVDTGSFYWWNDLVPTWEVFDQVPLNMHREHEHTNGITGDSATTTLEPTASGTTVNVAAVPLGSGYTVNGRYVTAPSPAVPPFSRDLTVGTLFTQQGLIQASSTEFGVVDVEDAGVGDYRVKLDPGAPLAIAAVRIVDINEAHSLGLYALRFDAADGLSWDNGEPVDVGVGTATGGRYRLYGPEYVNWIDVELTAGAILPALASDTYEVFASKKNDEHLLIAYFWWNGTAVVLGADKRYFGNLGAQELSDDFKASLTPAWNDLRGTMVYSGGDVSTLITPFFVRVTGPLVAYVDGVRKVVPISFGGQDGYTGLLLTATSYLYVDSAGVFQVSTTAPTGNVATIARVVCDGAGVTLIEDQRDPQIIVGQATRNSKLVFSETATARWHEASSTLNLEKNGDATGTQVYAGTFFAKDNQFIATGHVLLVNDAVSSDTPVTDALHDEIRKYQPPIGRDASLVGAIADGQEAQRFGFGCIGANACPVSFGANSVVIGVGTFYDFSGRKVVISSPVTIDVSTLGAGTYDVYWHSELNSGYGGFDVGGVLAGLTIAHGRLPWRSMLAFGVLDRTSGSNTAVTQCQMYATGSTCQEEFSIGADAGVVSGFGRGGNFSTLRKALVFRVCYSAGGGSDTYNAPRRFAVYDQIDEGANLIDFDSFEFVGLADDHLDGLHVYGSSVTATTDNRGTLRWGVDGAVSAVPMIDFRGQIDSIKFSDLRLEYNGDTGVDNNNCWIKNPGQNLVVENCGFAPQTGVGQPLYCLVNTGSVTLGGTTTTSTPGTLFKNCNFFDICAGTEMFSLTGAGLAGRIAFENCVFGGTATYARVVNIASATATCNVTFSDCTIASFNSAVIESASSGGKLLITGGAIAASAAAAVGPSVGGLDITNCTFTANASLNGVKLASGCRSPAGVTVTVGSAILTGCLFTDLANPGVTSNSDNLFFNSTSGSVLLGSTNNSVNVQSGLGNVSVKSALGKALIYTGAVAPTLSGGRSIGIASDDDLVLSGSDGVVVYAGGASPPASVNDDVIIKAESDVTMTGDVSVSILGLTGNHTTSIATQATTAVSTKIVNIGTGSAPNSTTQVTLGGVSGGAGSFLHGYNGDNGESLSLPSAFERLAVDVDLSDAFPPPTSIFTRRLPGSEYRFRCVLWLNSAETNPTITIPLQFIVGNQALGNWPIIAIRAERDNGAVLTDRTVSGPTASFTYSIVNGLSSLIIEGSLATNSTSPFEIMGFREPGSAVVSVLAGSYIEIIGF